MEQPKHWIIDVMFWKKSFEHHLTIFI